MKRYLSITVAIGLGLNIAIAQIGKGGTPKSRYLNNCFPVSFLNCNLLSPLSNDSLKHIDSLQQAGNDSTQHYNFGYTRTLNLNYTSGVEEVVWDSLANDSIYLWRIHIKSPGAYSTFLVLDTFQLPCGGEIFAYNPNKSQVLSATCQE